MPEIGSKWIRLYDGRVVIVKAVSDWVEYEFTGSYRPRNRKRRRTDFLACFTQATQFK